MSKKNENAKEFIEAIGALTEIWMITFNSFISHGVNREDALVFTQMLVKTYLESMKGGSKSCE